jgi:thiamine kinase-like enzyme
VPAEIEPTGPRLFSTHGVTVEAEIAVKRYRSPVDDDDRRLYGDEPHREWRALTLLAWLDSRWAESFASVCGQLVFAQGDANLANHLWDGHSVHLVDFEASGRGDRAAQLADFVEHVTVWAHAGIDAEAFLDRFDLNSGERERIAHLQRLFAAFWVMRLLPSGSAYRRNPPGTFERQASRLLDLLGSDL